MTPKIVRVKPDVADCNFGLVRMNSTVGLCESVRLQHVKHRGLACVVKSQENNVRRFLKEAHPFKCSFEKVNDKHFFYLIVNSFTLPRSKNSGTQPYLCCTFLNCHLIVHTGSHAENELFFSNATVCFD